MEPDPADPREVEGVLNPAVVRGTNGELYLLPRLVAAGNYSRIGLARVIFDARGDPVGVERLGVVLEPQEPYEINSLTGGGVEDPRVVYLAARNCYVMLYTAYGPTGPRIASAVSGDLITWRRTGLVRFETYHGIDIGELHNKDALLFPEPVPGPDGRLALALIHRPTVDAIACAKSGLMPPASSGRRRPSMWISYAPIHEIISRRHVVFGQHHLLATPQRPWEHVKIGGGAPPIRLSDGWLVLYHGVSGKIIEGIDQQQHARYNAGMLLLDLQDPRRVLYRSTQSVLAPTTAAERNGIVPRVVFPTGVDTRGESTIDIYYGMADTRIGVARYELAGQRSHRTAAAVAAA
jgi:beta-1,2-mannobiose phosphorylase / 1,2-beta-oligomannan phosphorylase